MRKVAWRDDELDEWRIYCRRVFAEEFACERPMRCRELYVVPHHMVVEHRDADGSRRFLPLEKGELVCRSPFDERCGVKSQLTLRSDGTLQGHCRRKHTPVRFRVTAFDHGLE